MPDACFFSGQIGRWRRAKVQLQVRSIDGERLPQARAPMAIIEGRSHNSGMAHTPVYPRRTLYPPIEPINSDWLDVGDGHELYYEESGNPRGRPVVVLHGGPGGGSDPGLRRFFNPEVYRIILFDQRGAGRSKPYASLEQNTTWKLVGDIEVLRSALSIKRWQVFGGSWGSTLAIAYAETHPERVTELVLRGIFLMTREELAWFFEAGGTSQLFPERWQAFIDPIPAAEHGDLQHAYYARLTSDDPTVREQAARAWSTWEGSTSCLIPSDELTEQFSSPAKAIAMARIECHYFVNGGFMEEGQLLRDIDRIRKIPAVIVQGRYDVICPVHTAYTLHKAWPEARYIVVPDAGHSAHEPGNTHELVTATDQFAGGA